MECLWSCQNVSLRFQSLLFSHPKFESALSVVCPLPFTPSTGPVYAEPWSTGAGLKQLLLGLGFESREGNLTLVESALVFFLFCFVLFFACLFVCLFFAMIRYKRLQLNIGNKAHMAKIDGRLIPDTVQPTQGKDLYYY